MVIADCAIGADIRLTGTSVDAAYHLRLRELGLGVGAVARVIQRAPFGGRILSIGGQRIAVDAHTTRAIAVESLPRASLVTAP